MSEYDIKWETVIRNVTFIVISYSLVLCAMADLDKKHVYHFSSNLRLYESRQEKLRWNFG